MDPLGINARSAIGQDWSISWTEATQTVEPPRDVFVEQGTHDESGHFQSLPLNSALVAFMYDREARFPQITFLISSVVPCGVWMPQRIDCQTGSFGGISPIHCGSVFSTPQKSPGQE